MTSTRTHQPLICSVLQVVLVPKRLHFILQVFVCASKKKTPIMFFSESSVPVLTFEPYNFSAVSVTWSNKDPKFAGSYRIVVQKYQERGPIREFNVTGDKTQLDISGLGMSRIFLFSNSLSFISVICISSVSNISSLYTPSSNWSFLFFLFFFLLFRVIFSKTFSSHYIFGFRSLHADLWFSIMTYAAFFCPQFSIKLNRICFATPCTATSSLFYLCLIKRSLLQS